MMSISGNPGERPREAGSWYGAELVESDWRLAIPDAVVDELRAATDDAAGPPTPATLPATAALMRTARARLFDGCGVVVAGRLPVLDWSEERASRGVAVLSSFLGPPVVQTHDGTTYYPVKDRGVKPEPGVRRSLTNVAQPFHTDGPWVRLPPWIVGLHCLRAARSGGMSRCISLKRLFADLAERSPELAERVRDDVYWHRQGEHAPGDPPFSAFPMAWTDDAGRWCGRYYADYVETGYRAAGIVPDAAIRRALDTLARLDDEPGRRLEFMLREGEVLWLNNRWCAHARSAFEASAETDRPRHVVRVWHRDSGDPVALDG